MSDFSTFGSIDPNVLKSDMKKSRICLIWGQSDPLWSQIYHPLLNPVPQVVGCDAEGEARRYFDHAMTLRDTVLFLRHNPELREEIDGTPIPNGQGIDLLRCESLLGLDPETRSRVLNRNYR